MFYTQNENYREILDNLPGDSIPRDKQKTS